MAWARFAVGLKAYTDVMSSSASEFYEAGLALPPSVRRPLPSGYSSRSRSLSTTRFEEAWTNELSSRVDDIVSGKVTAVSGEQVSADIAVRRAAHNA